MIFAKVDVKLRDHERAHRAGAAMATWTWALLYVREQETDGFIPDVALRGAWVGERVARQHAAVLVTVGLWEAVSGGWRICKYGAKNETRMAIAARRAEVRERVAKHRAKRDCNANGNVLPTQDSGALVPGSRSVKSEVRDRLPDSEEGESAERGRVRRDLPFADDARGVWDSRTMNRDAGKPGAEVWMDFCGHFAGQDFGSRETLLGRWQKWIGRQFQIADRDRAHRRVDTRQPLLDVANATWLKAGGGL